MPKSNNDPLHQEFSGPVKLTAKNAEIHKNKLKEQGLDPDRGPFRKALQSLEQSGKVFNEVEKARQMVTEDSSRSEMNKRIALKQYSDKKKEELDNIISEGESAIRGLISSIDNEIESEMQKKAAKSTYARATWDHIRGLEDAQARMMFVKGEIDAGNWDTVEDILAVDRPFITGLKKNQIEMLREQYKKKRYADKIKMRDAAAEIEKDFDYATLPAISKFDRFDSTEVSQAISQSKKTANFLNDE